MHQSLAFVHSNSESHGLTFGSHLRATYSCARLNLDVLVEVPTSSVS